MPLSVSDAQRVALDWVRTYRGKGRRSLIINSLAGGGKTHAGGAIIEDVLNEWPKDKVCYNAFGKRNVRDMNKKQGALEFVHKYRTMPHISTRHSLGLSTMRGARWNKMRTSHILE